MKKISNILLIRAGSSQRNRIEHPVHCPPPLSLKYTKELLAKEKGYYVRIIDCMNMPSADNYLQEAVVKSLSDLILIEIASSAFEEGLRLCKMIKENTDALIVAVGSDVTERYEYYLSLDSLFAFILRGEYELEACALVNRLNETLDIETVKEYYNTQKNKEIALIDNLDSMPCLTWEKEELMRYPYRYPLRYSKKIIPGYVSTSRGCKYGCTFCSPAVRKSYGKKLRLRNAVKIVDEMESLHELGVNLISFEDDDFTGSEEHVLSVCKELCRRDLDIKWTCHARIDEVTPDLLRVMKEAGCILILFGIESGSRRIIRILNKASPKMDWLLRARSTFDKAREIGIATCALFIVGSPTETRADVEESVQLSFKLNPEFIKVHNFTLYPGSQDYKRYRSQFGDVLSQHHYLPPIVNVSDMDYSELKSVQMKFYRRFFFRPAFLCAHFYRYGIFYVKNSTWSFPLLKEVFCFLIFSAYFKNNKSKGNLKKDHDPMTQSRSYSC